MSNDSDQEDSSGGPLSLQDQCFIYILAHLKDYPVDLLALLPLRWRRKLLRAAPPLQLCMLESTPVSDGVDTDLLWEEMSHLADSVWVNYTLSESDKSHDLFSGSHGLLDGGSHTQNSASQVTLKERFVNYICHMLMSESNRRYAITRISEFLLAVHQDRLDSDVVRKMTTVHIPTQLLFSPPYYFIPFRCPRYKEGEIATLMISVGALPTMLEIHEEQLMRTNLWQMPSQFALVEFFEKLLKNLKFFSFHCSRFYSRPLNLIMSSFYSHDQSNQESPIGENHSLESLEFHSICKESVGSLADHFSRSKGFMNLKRLHVQLTETAAPLGNKLAAIVTNQLHSLECFYLSNLVFKQYQYTSTIGFDEYQLFSSLASFISRSQFRRLILDSIQNISQAMLEKILLAFFSAEPNHKQLVCIKNSTIKKSGSIPFQIQTKETKDSNVKSNLATSIACTVHKNVLFESVTIPTEFFTWFEQVGSIYLHSLEFRGMTVLPKVPSRQNHTPFSDERYVTDTRKVIRRTQGYVDDGEREILKAKLSESKDPRLVFYTHPGFRCMKFNWSK